jgi:hypothetical protein
MEILDGVKLGEEVALTDVDNLADGMKISVAKGDLPAADAGERGAKTPSAAKQVSTSGE